MRERIIQNIMSNKGVGHKEAIQILALAEGEIASAMGDDTLDSDALYGEVEGILTGYGIDVEYAGWF